MADHKVTVSGTEVAVAPGDRVVICVEENATTGYQWSVARMAGPLEQESTDLVRRADAAPGAAGERRVIVRAVGTGRGTVELALRRVWEGGAEPAARFSVDVSVA